MILLFRHLWGVREGERTRGIKEVKEIHYFSYSAQVIMALL